MCEQLSGQRGGGGGGGVNQHAGISVILYLHTQFLQLLLSIESLGVLELRESSQHNHQCPIYL